MLLGFFMIMAGCINQSSQSGPVTPTLTSVASQVTPNAAKTNTPSVVQTPIQTIPSLTKFEQFEKGLNDANIKYVSSSKSAEMIGAEEGKGYEWGVYGESGYGGVELYRFKENSEELKSATKNKSIILKGVGSFPIDAVNANMVIITTFGSTDNTNKEKIMAIFYNLK